MLRSRYIKRYSVKINAEKKGTGVLIKIDDNNCYLATAKHNFSKKNRQTDGWLDVHMLEVQEAITNGTIEVTQNNEKICHITSVKYEHRDLIVFNITSITDYIDNLDPIEILENNGYTNETDYFFHGYPEDNDTFIEKLSARNDIGDYIYTVQDSQNHRPDYFPGCSGSGVFINDDSKYYLVGILLKKENAPFFHIFDLPKILEERIPSIPIKKDKFDMPERPDMYTRMINRNSNNFLVKKAKNLFRKKHVFNDLRQNTLKLKRFTKYIQDTNKFDELEQEYHKELADMYLLATFVSKEFEGNSKNTIKYFEKAKKFEPKYSRYLNQIIEGKELVELLLETGKIAYMDKDYSTAKENFIKVLSLNMDNTKRIFIHECLVDIAEAKNNNDDKIIEYKNLLKLYPISDKLKKAKIHYELSLLYEEDYNKWDELKKGLNIVEYESSDSFLEIKYKMLKEKDKMAKQDDISSKTREILEKLAQINPIYQDELTKINQIEMERFLFLKELQIQKDINMNEKKEVNTKIEFAKIISFLIIFILLVIVAILEKINIGIIIGGVIFLMLVLFKFIKKNKFTRFIS